jgi:hypothetical protein
MAAKRKVPNTREEALKKALREMVFGDKELQEHINAITGIVLSEAEQLRGGDQVWYDGMHCEVHNDVVNAIEETIDMLVLNWDED